MAVHGRLDRSGLEGVGRGDQGPAQRAPVPLRLQSRGDPMAEADEISTTVTSSGEAVEVWLREVRSVHIRRLHELIVGIDVEWRPSYRADHNPVAVLQLCVSRRCLIFQLLHADYIPGALGEFLGETAFRFVGACVDADVERLSDDHELKVANAVDLRGLAAEGMHLPELRQAELRAIAAAVMSHRREAAEGGHEPLGRVLPKLRADQVRMHHRRLRVL
jgi:hypothetical protein